MNRWDQLQTLFHEALALPPEQREAFLQESCADDPDLLKELQALLASEQLAATLSESAVKNSVASYLENVDTALTGGQLGAYELIEVIGSGGMGSVYRAARSDGSYDLQVAVKVVKKGMDSQSVLQRFEQERQILARLDHPNIARLIDGGVTDDGRPYFVMELIDGVPITEYCDQHQLGINDRLGLFRSVCDAVHFAHQNLVVHRDLKPSNILVTADGSIKLLDFGIAKSLDAGEDIQATQTGMVPFTPAYAAPEQLLGDLVSTATDTYALGVVLYELLTGLRPFEPAKTVASFRSEVLSGEPKKPSTMVSHALAGEQRDMDAAVAARGTSRRLDISALQTRLRGDLDAICLTALERNPSERYASVQQFSGDLQKHLNNEPVSAQNATLHYRVSKFLRRNRAAVGIAAAFAISLAAVVTFYTVRLAEERDMAVAEQATTAEVVEFVIGLFEQADPGETGGEDVSVRSVVDAGALRMETALRSEPVIRARMLGVLGRLQYVFNATEEARTLLNAALEEQIALDGPEHPRVAEIQLRLGNLAQGDGQHDAAAQLFASARNIHERSSPPNSEALQLTIGAQAFLAETLGEFDEALSLYQQALTIAEQRSGSQDDESLALAQKQLGGIYRLLDQLDQAEPLLVSALAMQDRIYQGIHPESADTRRQLAGLYRDSNRYEEALPLYQRVIANRTKMFGPLHREVINTLNSYSQLQDSMGDSEGMLETNQIVIERLLQKGGGYAAESLPAIYHNRAYGLKSLGRYDESIAMFERAIEAFSASGLGEDHPNRAYSIASMGQAYRLRGDFTKAAELGEQALQLRQPHFAEDHRLMSEVYSDLGWAYMDLAQYEKAESFLVRSYNNYLKKFGATHEKARVPRASLYELYGRMGNEAEQAKYKPLE